MHTHVFLSTYQQEQGLQGALSLAATRAKRAPKRREMDFGAPTPEEEEMRVGNEIEIEGMNEELGCRQVDRVISVISCTIYPHPPRHTNTHSGARPRRRRKRSGSSGGKEEEAASSSPGRPGLAQSACWTARMSRHRPDQRRRRCRRGMSVCVCSPASAYIHLHRPLVPSIVLTPLHPTLLTSPHPASLAAAAGRRTCGTTRSTPAPTPPPTTTTGYVFGIIVLVLVCVLLWLCSASFPLLIAT